jgi:uncharacterized DUF497 family protein
VRIGDIVWIQSIEEKCLAKHHVRSEEVEDLLRGRPRINLVERGERLGEDIYLARGRTEAGRYLMVFFIAKVDGSALIVSARATCRAGSGGRMAEKRKPDRPERFSTGTTLEEIGEFWDTHDFTDYEALCPDVTDQFEIEIRSTRHLVAIDPELMERAITSAHKQGIAVQTLINLAVRDALDRSSRR